MRIWFRVSAAAKQIVNGVTLMSDRRMVNDENSETHHFFALRNYHALRNKNH